MSIFEMAKQYYPRLWNRERIEALAASGRLTEEEAAELLKQKEEPNDSGR